MRRGTAAFGAHAENDVVRHDLKVLSQTAEAEMLLCQMKIRLVGLKELASSSGAQAIALAQDATRRQCASEQENSKDIEKVSNGFEY